MPRLSWLIASPRGVVKNLLLALPKCLPSKANHPVHQIVLPTSQTAHRQSTSWQVSLRLGQDTNIFNGLDLVDPAARLGSELLQVIRRHHAASGGRFGHYTDTMISTYPHRRRREGVRANILLFATSMSAKGSRMMPKMARGALAGSSIMS